MNIGQRIKNIIYRGKSFWNWKNEDNINVSIPAPIDHRLKISYDTNIEFIFNREVLESFTYTKKEDVPKLRDIIPDGYKLLYPNSEISIYNNNRFVLVYDWYDVIVHYREETDIHTDIKIFKKRFQYGALITKDIIDWPAGRKSKQEWTDFPVGELTPARVIDRYVYLEKSGPSAEYEWGSVPIEFQNDTIINYIDTNQSWINSNLRIPPGYYTQDSRASQNIKNLIEMYRKPMLLEALQPLSYFQDIDFGRVNNWDITQDRSTVLQMDIMYKPQKYNDNTTTDNIISQSYHYAPVIYYDSKDPRLEFLNSSSIDENKLKAFLEDIVPKMKAKYPSTFEPYYSSDSKTMYQHNKQYIDKLWITVDSNLGMPILGTLLDVNYLPNMSTSLIIHINDILTLLEEQNNEHQWYYKTKKFCLDNYVKDISKPSNNLQPSYPLTYYYDYRKLNNVTIGTNNHNMVFYLCPMRSIIDSMGIYLNKDNKMYKYYVGCMNLYGTANVTTDVINTFPSIASDGVNVRVNNKVIRLKYIKDATNKNTYAEYKSAPGEALPRQYYNLPDLMSPLAEDFHYHKGSDTKATLIDNEQERFNQCYISELSILIETRKEGGGQSNPEYNKKKYRIHFFDENGKEMKHYLTDQYIKDGEPPSPYPPKEYILDPNKPWTRNPNDPHEIYVYLIKKECRIVYSIKVSNPSGYKHKFWQDVLNKSPMEIYTETQLYGYSVDLANILENKIKPTFAAQMDDVDLINVEVDGKIYNKNDLLIEENPTRVTFNFNINKSDFILVTTSVQKSKKEFEFINSYFDYSLAAFLVKKEYLDHNSDNGRTKKLVTHKEFDTNNPELGTLDCGIVYGKKLYLELIKSMNVSIPKIEIIKVETNVETVINTLTDVPLNQILGNNAIGGDKLGANSDTSCNSFMGNLYSYIRTFSYGNNQNKLTDLFYGLVMSNSLSSSQDLKVRITFDSKLYETIIDNKYALEIKIIPTAFLPNTANTDVPSPLNYPDLFIKAYDEWYSFDTNLIHNWNAYESYNPFMILHESNDTLNNMDHDMAINRNYKELYNKFKKDLSCTSLEYIFLTNMEVFIGTYGFAFRTYQMNFLCSRTIPVVSINATVTQKLTNVEKLGSGDADTRGIPKHHSFVLSNPGKSTRLTDTMIDSVYSNDLIYHSNEYVWTETNKEFEWFHSTVYYIKEPELFLYPTERTMLQHYKLLTYGVRDQVQWVEFIKHTWVNSQLIKHVRILYDMHVFSHYNERFYINNPGFNHPSVLESFRNNLYDLNTDSYSAVLISEAPFYSDANVDKYYIEYSDFQLIYAHDYKKTLYYPINQGQYILRYYTNSTSENYEHSVFKQIQLPSLWYPIKDPTSADHRHILFLIAIFNSLTSDKHGFFNNLKGRKVVISFKYIHKGNKTAIVNVIYDSKGNIIQEIQNDRQFDPLANKRDIVYNKQTKIYYFEV